MRVRSPHAAKLVAAGLLTAAPALSLVNTGTTWLSEAYGRACGHAGALAGINDMYGAPPYAPAADGFGADTAAFLAANDFDATRLTPAGTP